MKNIFLLLLLSIVAGCTEEKELTVTQIEGVNIEINDSIKGVVEYENFLKPYRNHIASQLNETLAYNVRHMNRTDGALNSSIGNMMADAVIELSGPIFKQRTQNEIDFVLLNYGGIRATMEKGDVTRKTAFEIMPFENEIVILELSPKRIQEMLDYLRFELLAHPVSGIEINLNKDYEISEVKIQGTALDSTKNYFVATSDYLRNGGDRMYFFEDPVSETPLDYKVRNVLIDYFIKKDTIDSTPDKRFIKSD
tara:strand:+ start:218114 stop:218869 length:756 start_codon:yes stop_codon:yes gene_type:complete